MSAVPDDPRSAQRTLDLALRTGEVLLAGGAGAAEVTGTCTAVAEAGGLRRVECDITFTSIALSAQAAPDTAPVAGMRLVQQRALDYTRVTAVHNLCADLVAGRTSREDAEQTLQRVSTARHPYPRAAVTVARSTLAAAVAVLLGAGAVVTAAAFTATVVIDLVNGWLDRRQLPAFFQNAVGGLIATAVALGLVAADIGVRPSLVVAGGIVLLLPGVTVVGAVQDAITGFYVTAGARAFEVFLLTAGIVCGIAVALTIGVRLGLPVRIGDPPVTGLGQLSWQLVAAATVSASFAVANYAPRRAVPVAGLAGALGWAVFSAIVSQQLSGTLASAVAAVTIGLGSHLVARRQRVPALVYVVAGIIPLLPGLTIYRGMRRLAEGDSVGGITLLGGAVAIGLALAAGALLGELLAGAARRSAPHRGSRAGRTWWTHSPRPPRLGAPRPGRRGATDRRRT